MHHHDYQTALLVVLTLSLLVGGAHIRNTLHYLLTITVYI